MDNSSSGEEESTGSSSFDSYNDNFCIEKFSSPLSETKNEDEQVTTSDKVITWPSNENFNITLGFTKIEELLETWKRKGCWKHCIDFICQENAISSDYYFYEVKWSIPTKLFPVPALTASVFFRIEVNHLKPLEKPVQVTYQYETSRFVHSVGRIKFQEKWLEDILLYKLMILPYVTF